MRAWQDDDGRHVWFAHECTSGPEVTMLPYPTWRIDTGVVHPSIHCANCGFHEHVTVDSSFAERLARSVRENASILDRLT